MTICLQNTAGPALAAEVPVWLCLCQDPVHLQPSTCNDLTERPSASKAPTWHKPGTNRPSVCVRMSGLCHRVCAWIYVIVRWCACMGVFVNISKRDDQISVCVTERESSQTRELGTFTSLWNVKRDNLMLAILPSRPVLSRQQMACWHNTLYNSHTPTHTDRDTHTERERELAQKEKDRASSS